MSKKYINVGQITELKELASKMELMTSHIYELINNIEVRKTTSGVKPNGVKPLSFWYDEKTNQLYFFTGANGDKLVG